METIALGVTQSAYATAKAARAADRVPMVYYGKGVKNINFSVPYQDFRRTYAKTGKSTIITLVNEKGEKFPVLVHEVQYDPVTDLIRHVDMMAVDMAKPIQTKIPLKFVGVAPAVKDLGGVFVHSRDAVRVKCLPKDLVHEIEVDISSLVDFKASLTVKDIQVPQGIVILEALTINIATVSAPRDIEAEEAAMKAEDAALKATAAAKAAGEVVPGGPEILTAKKEEPTAEEGVPEAAAPAEAKAKEGKKEGK